MKARGWCRKTKPTSIHQLDVYIYKKSHSLFFRKITFPLFSCGFANMLNKPEICLGLLTRRLFYLLVSRHRNSSNRFPGEVKFPRKIVFPEDWYGEDHVNVTHEYWFSWLVSSTKRTWFLSLMNPSTILFHAILSSFSITMKTMKDNMDYYYLNIMKISPGTRWNGIFKLTHEIFSYLPTSIWFTTLL